MSRETAAHAVQTAVAALARGGIVVVLDDEDRENEGDLIFAAEKATPELVAFMVRYTSGYLCVPLDGAICDRLGLLPMYAVNQDKHGTAYTTQGMDEYERVYQERAVKGLSRRAKELGYEVVPVATPTAEALPH